MKKLEVSKNFKAKQIKEDYAVTAEEDLLQEQFYPHYLQAKLAEVYLKNLDFVEELKALEKDKQAKEVPVPKGKSEVQSHIAAKGLQSKSGSSTGSGESKDIKEIRKIVKRMYSFLTSKAAQGKEKFSLSAYLGPIPGLDTGRQALKKQMDEDLVKLQKFTSEYESNYSKKAGGGTNLIVLGKHFDSEDSRLESYLKAKSYLNFVVLPSLPSQRLFCSYRAYVEQLKAVEAPKPDFGVTLDLPLHPLAVNRVKRIGNAITRISSTIMGYLLPVNTAGEVDLNLRDGDAERHFGYCSEAHALEAFPYARTTEEVSKVFATEIQIFEKDLNRVLSLRSEEAPLPEAVFVFSEKLGKAQAFFSETMNTCRQVDRALQDIGDFPLPCP